MDKFEYKIKLDEINSLIADRNLRGAADVADTVDWTNVKDVRTLCRISDVYKANHLFEQSMEILLLAYRKQQTRPIIKSLCELSIELGDLIPALNYYKEFITVAPKDPTQYVLKYKLYKAQGVSLEEQISVLEELKKYDYVERWAFELAELYHRVGQGDRCVEECNELILWFVDGKYVLRAYELKAQHKPLTEEETYKYELLRQAGGELNIDMSLKEDPKAESEEKPELEVKKVDVSPYNTQSLQAVVAEGFQDIIDQQTRDISDGKVPMSYEEAVELDRKAREEAGTEEETEDAEDSGNTEASEDPANFEVREEEENLLVTQVIDPIINEEPVGQELLEEETGEVSLSEDGQTEEEEAGENMPEEGFDGKEPDEEPTRELTGVAKKLAEAMKDDQEESRSARPVLPDTDRFTPLPGIVPEAKLKNPDAINSTGVIEKFHKGSNMDSYLSQEYNGQISMVVPEEPKKEKQITGQISIGEVMEEWDRKKKESEERRIAELRKRVRKETDALFADFEESTKEGLLEQLEKDMISAARKEENSQAGKPKEIKVSDIENKDSGLSPTEEILEAAIAEELESEKKLQKAGEDLPEEETSEEDLTIENLPDEEEGLSENEDDEYDDYDEIDDSTADLSEHIRRTSFYELPDDKEESPGIDKDTESSGDGEDLITEDPEGSGEGREETDDPAGTAQESAGSEEEEPEGSAEASEETEDLSDGEEEPGETGEEEPDDAEKESGEGSENGETDSAESEGDETGKEASGEGSSEEKKPSGKKERSGRTKKLTSNEVRSIAKAALSVKDDEEEPVSRERELTDQEKERFARFIHHRSTRRQLANTLEHVTLAAYTGNVLVTGEEETELTAFSKLLIHEIQSSDGNFTGKVAKVSGENLNNRDVAKTVQTVAGGALIISDAEHLKVKTVNSLLSSLQTNEMGVVVIIEGRSDTADKLTEKVKGFPDAFNLRVDLHAFDNKTLVEYAQTYAYDCEYSIDELGILALHTRIDDMQTADHEVTLAEIEEIVEEAIYYADRKTPAHFFDVLFGKRYDKEDMIILREKDFMHY
ncbi:MAG: hypothetical protein K6F53_11470 [Lachnospiraceae bacterium]|nr:hypothetical protein [Lachnospiraceae bacterium]